MLSRKELREAFKTSAVCGECGGDGKIRDGYLCHWVECLECRGRGYRLAAVARQLQALGQLLAVQVLGPENLDPADPPTPSGP